MTLKPRTLNSTLCTFLLILVVVAVISFLNPSASTTTSTALQSVNGRIAFRSDNTIFTINAVGIDQITLISDGQNQSPSWKPDGTKIAFGRRGGSDPAFAIHTMNPDGTGLQKISTDPSNDSQPTWSPDGGKIASAFALLQKSATASPSDVRR